MPIDRAIEIQENNSSQAVKAKDVTVIIGEDSTKVFDDTFDDTFE